MIADFDMAEFCGKSAGLLQFVGYALLIFKIAIPLVIIILGALDFGKAVVASKDEEIKSSAKRLLWRAIAGVVIFFIPNVVTWIFGTVSDYKNEADSFKVCEECIIHPTGGQCVAID